MIQNTNKIHVLDIHSHLSFTQCVTLIQINAFSLLEPPDSDETVRWLLPLLLDSDRVDMLDLDERPDSDPDPDPEPDTDPDRADLVFRPVFEDRPDLAVRPDLYVRPDPEDMPDTSERCDPDDSSETEDSLVLEVISDTEDRAVVDLFCSRSGTCWTLMTLNKEKDSAEVEFRFP